MKRREFLTAAASLLGAPALVGLTRRGAPRRYGGGFVDDGGAVGHRLRDGAAMPTARRTERAPIVIVGGGMAGLCAAWELDRRGMHDYVVLELERAAGGNARWGENEGIAFPWAAHYVPVPGPDTTLVRELFAGLGVLRDGAWDERALCFAPQERLFLHGAWREGIEPDYALDRAGREEMRRFAETVERWRANGAFTIPLERGVARADASALALDRMSMTEWMRANGFASPALAWYVDYACRDDYGARASATSAWAGIHYFASRQRDDPGPLTWPEGNGFIARHLIARAGERLRTGMPVHRIERTARRDGSPVRVLAGDAAFAADVAIFAAPSHLAAHVIEDERPRTDLVMSPWLTANLLLDRWPQERGFAPAWDNVIVDSPALGYVVANHQSVATHDERWVWTYYWALADGAPAARRRLLLERPWRAWAELILDDLSRAHPDIRDCVARIDIMRLGHAMARPVPGFLASPSRHPAPALDGRVLFAHSDLSGLSIFEEAQAHGVAAARRALERLGRG